MPVDDIEVLDCQQGSLEWYAARRGIPTASMFQTILAGGEGRKTYLYKLAGERLSNEDPEPYNNAAMERGRRMEPVIRADYEFKADVEVQQVGFIRNRKTGCSPDGLVGDDGVVEFKSTAPHILIPMLEAGRFPNKFLAQCQGALMITGRKWCDLVVFWPQMPRLCMITRRNEDYISELRDAINVFDLELRRLVERLKQAK
jgi:YqaJ-like viral recombinase domain